ncbi:MAG: ATP synthase subunit I [Cellvibrionaceae bacterium]|nr:ATP synthase subunit I [Cellvibrionaceae bacterium]
MNSKPRGDLTNPMDVMDKPFYQLIIRLWAVQCGLLFVLSLAALTVDAALAYSIALGGLVYCLPNSYFALLVLRQPPAGSGAVILGRFYRGETNKFLLTAVCFAVIFILLPRVNAVALFAVYIFMALVQSFVVHRFMVQR